MPSKSARKRDAQAVKALGDRLLKLTDEQLASMPLDNELREVVVATRNMRSNSALRRQKLFLAKQLRHADTTALVAAVEALDGDRRHDRRLFQRAEQWRDRLLQDGGQSLDELSGLTGRDNAEIRSLLGSLHPALPERERKRIGRELFREIHADLAAGLHNDGSNI